MIDQSCSNNYFVMHASWKPDKNFSIYETEVHWTLGCQNIRRSQRNMMPRSEVLTIDLGSPKNIIPIDFIQYWIYAEPYTEGQSKCPFWPHLDQECGQDGLVQSVAIRKRLEISTSPLGNFLYTMSKEFSQLFSSIRQELANWGHENWEFMKLEKFY